LPRLKAKRSTLLAIPLVAAALVVLGVLVQPALKKRLPTDVAAVDSKTSVVTHRRQPGAQTAAGQAAWRDVEALDDPDQQKARVKKWLKTYKGHPRVPDALRLAEALRFAVPRRQIIFTHVEGSPRAHAYGVFLGDDQLLTYGDDDVVKRWNAKTGALAAKRTYRNMEEIRSLVPFGDAGRFVAGHPIYLLVASLRDTYQSRIQARLAARLAVSPDGRRVVAPGVDRVVEYDLETQAELRRYSIAVSATAAAYSPSGERLVVFTGDKGKDSAGNEIYIWNTVDGEQVARERVSGLVRSIAYTQDGKTLFVGTSTGVLAELDAETGRGLGTLQSDELYRKARGMGLTAHRGSVKGLAFSHDYEVLYTVSQGAMEWSCELRLWDMKTRSPLRPPILRPYKLDGIAFSPDGTHFCLATEAGVVEVWSRE
jgi:WD40 repeat protein